MVSFLKKYKYEFILGLLICIYIAYFTVATFLKYDNFYAGRYDLGNMDQTVWNTINGRIFQMSSDNGSIISRLAYHADFMLVLLSPFYLLWNSPKMLLLIQTIILSFGAIFSYLIAKDVIKNKLIALIFGFIFLMNPFVQYTNLYDFHAVTLATTFLLASFYFLIKHRYFWLIIFLILAGITKEQIWIVVSLFGLVLLFNKAKNIKFLGAVIFIFSILIFYCLVNYFIPQNLGSQHFALKYYSDFGESPISVIRNIFLNPEKTFGTIFDIDRLGYLGQLFLPLGFLSILSPLTLLFAVPSLLINLLSNNSGMRQIYYQYSSAVTPFIFISSILAVQNIFKWFTKISKTYFLSYLIFFTILSSYFFGPLPGAKYPSIDMFTKPQKNKLVINTILPKISEKYSVAATNNLGAHLSHREIIYTIPIGVDKADVLLFLLNDRFAQPSLNAQKQIVEKLKQDKNYIKVFEKDDFVVFKKQGVLL